MSPTKAAGESTASPLFEEKLRQEKALLLAIRDAFKKLIIVGHPIKATYDQDGIYYMSIFDFLLKSDSLLW